MTNIQTANTIKLICKQKSISITQMLKDCEITKSFIYDLEKRNTSPSCDKLSKIADYLNVSVDYLLGRTDEPQTVSNSGTSIRQQYIGDYGSATITNGSKNEDDKDNTEILEMIKKLSVVQKAEIILKINEMINKNT